MQTFRIKRIRNEEDIRQEEDLVLMSYLQDNQQSRGRAKYGIKSVLHGSTSAHCSVSHCSHEITKRD